MNLILDFGNTQKKIALFDQGRMVHTEARAEITTSDLEAFGNAHPGITRCILSSVTDHSPDIEPFLRSRYFFIPMNETTPVPLINLYRTPNTLGRDRLAAAVGGAAEFPGRNLLVICAGTALTFDFVSSGGEYLGGSIAPGMQMRFRALHTFTDRLPLISYTEETSLIGADTAGSILSGVVNGMTAEMEGMAGRYAEQFPGLVVILGGGDLNYFFKRLKISIFARPNIVIHGLQQILELNAHPSH